MKMKKMTAMMLAFVMLFVTVLSVGAATETHSGDIAILYTNDVHTYIDGALSYDTVAALKKELQKQYRYVFLVDAGDHIQGTAYGSLDMGEHIIQMMNAAEYDVATLGNHEFDYGMSGCLNAVECADFPYISANFYHVENGERTDNVLERYVIFDCGDEKIAFVGITTPETIEKSTPVYFQDENGNFIYGISGGKDGTELQNDVQKAVNEARGKGATKVIVLGHLGIDPSSEPWTSRETIANVSGIDAFIDGHSHSVVECETVRDKDGREVLLTQTGSCFDRIGMMVIDAETSEFTADFVECEPLLAQDGTTVVGQKFVSDLYDGTEWIADETVQNIKENWIAEIDQKLGETIGSANITLDNYDAEGNRLVRCGETNSGDFSADALYYLFDEMGMAVDAAVMNGGGIRNAAVTGEISYKTCKDIHTFGNIACLQTVTGKQLLDALEWGARHLGVGENGGFLQVSGITYKIDSTVPNTVKENAIGAWTAAPNQYRVFDVNVYNKETNSYEPLDETAIYHLAGYNYTLRNLGDGYAMFDGAVNVLDYVAEDYMVLANYVKGFKNGVVDAQNSPLKEKYPNMLLDYGTVNGSGRIKTAAKEMSGSETAFTHSFADVREDDWFCDAVKFVNENGMMNGVAEHLFAPDEALTRGMAVTILYRAQGEPTVNRSIPFEDVDADSYYANAVNWAQQNGIVNGVSEQKFAPEETVTREQIATMMYRYACYQEIVPADEESNGLDYADSAEISDYATEGVMYCTDKDIMSGKEEKRFAPLEKVTRAEVATILQRTAIR